MSNHPVLDAVLRHRQIQHTAITDNLLSIIHMLAQAGQRISDKVREGALADILGSTQQENVQGEVQKKLDLIANQILIDACDHTPSILAFASEEMEDIQVFHPSPPLHAQNTQDRYLLLVDPLDGSSNIEVNVSIGTIFSILRVPKGCENTNPTALREAFLQAGTQQVGAGYMIYGPQTMLVLSLGFGVEGFTLDPISHEWIHTHPHLRIPESTQEFAINASNERHWYAPVQRYVDELKVGKTGSRQKDFNMRWIASMVADIHRILMRGGIFMYPADQRNPDKPGRLRLMYEANPMAFLVEQAGGAASDGQGRLLDKSPLSLHERVAVFLGSKEEVERVVGYHC